VGKGHPLAAALSAALLAAAGGAALAQGTLSVYCSTDAAWCDEKSRQFERATGVRVEITRRSTGEALARIRAEAGNPRADIWYGGTGDPHLQGAEEGLFEPYTSPEQAQQHEWSTRHHALAGTRSTGVYRITLGFGYNRELLARKRLPAPACWADLLRPEYRGEVELAHPGLSGTGYTQIATMVQLLGEDKAFEHLVQLHRNVNRYAQSGSGIGKSVARGETLLGVTFIDEFVLEVEAGFPVQIVAPCEGTGYAVGAMSILKGARNPATARRWYDWALGREAQSLAKGATAYAFPSRRDATWPKALEVAERAKLVDYDFKRFGSGEERKRLIARWERDVNSLRK
jgi:iron(III) transport system substrate-binding protein